VAASVARAVALAAGDARVGILGSPALRRIGLFDRAFAGTGVAPIWPGDEAALLAAIRAIKAGEPPDAPRAALRTASADLLRRGARLQLVACTEFSLVAEPTVTGAQRLDTLDVLVSLVRDFALNS
jgi:aspartate racemase